MGFPLFSASKRVALSRDLTYRNRERILTVLGAVEKRIKEVSGSIHKLQDELKELLGRCIPSSDADAYLVAQVASSLGELLEVAILDKSGKIIG